MDILNNVFQEDFKSFLPKIEDNSIDLIVIDPPYEINFQNLSWDSVNLNWEFLASHLKRILKPSGNLIIFQGWSNVVRVIPYFEAYELKLQNWIVWDRIKGRGAKYNLVSTREDILWFIKEEKTTFNVIDSTIKKKTKGMGSKNGSEYRRLSNVWTDVSPVAPMSREYNGYPTQKPVKLIERIIKVFSNENDIVLDCFCGSGTTAIASKNLNRFFIVSDKNEEAVNLTNKRIENYSGN